MDNVTKDEVTAEGKMVVEREARAVGNLADQFDKSFADVAAASELQGSCAGNRCGNLSRCGAANGPPAFLLGNPRTVHRCG